MALAPCPSCSRHVRASEPTCPFCATPFVGERPPAAGLARFGSRAALVLGGLALGACNSPEVPTLPTPVTPAASTSAFPAAPGSAAPTGSSVEPTPTPPPAPTASAEPDAGIPRAAVAIYGAPSPPRPPKPTPKK